MVDILYQVCADDVHAEFVELGVHLDEFRAVFSIPFQDFIRRYFAVDYYVVQDSVAQVGDEGFNVIRCGEDE